MKDLNISRFSYNKEQKKLFTMASDLSWEAGVFPTSIKITNSKTKNTHTFTREQYVADFQGDVMMFIYLSKTTDCQVEIFND